MEAIKKSFISHPTKKTLFLFTLVWVLGMMLLTLSVTDLFTESFFQKGYLMIYFLMAASTLVTVKLYFNYWKNNK